MPTRTAARSESHCAEEVRQRFARIGGTEQMESFSIVMQLYSILRKAELSGDTAGKFAPVARRRMPENLPFVLVSPTLQAASPQPAVMSYGGHNNSRQNLRYMATQTLRHTQPNHQAIEESLVSFWRSHRLPGYKLVDHGDHYSLHMLC